MRNLTLLVRKDLISALITPSSLATLAVLFLLLVWSNPALVFVLVIYLMVVNLFAQEENDLVCNVVGILPIRMEQVVLARYVYSWLLLAVTAVLGGAINGVLNVFVFHGSDWFSQLLFALASALLMLSIIMPLNYRLGVARARIASMVVYILMVIVATGINVLTNMMDTAVPGITGTAGGLSVTAIAALAVLVTAVLSVGSLFISLKIKKL